MTNMPDPTATIKPANVARCHVHLWFDQFGAVWGVGADEASALASARTALEKTCAAEPDPVERAALADGVEWTLAAGFTISLNIPNGVPSKALIRALMLTEDTARTIVALLETT